MACDIDLIVEFVMDKCYFPYTLGVRGLFLAMLQLISFTSHNRYDNYM